MKDKWTSFNEVVQNLLALAIVATYLYMVLNGKTVPIELTGFTAAILLFFGFKIYKASNGGAK